MEKIYLVAIGLIITNSARSQNYIPILLDSLHTWAWGIGIHGDTIAHESWAGFSYDMNDSLIQSRSPSSRFTYSYGVDTIFWLAETIDTSNNWNVFSRTTSVYEDGKIISKLTETFKNNSWENSALYTYFYDAAQHDTLYLLQHWNNGTWVNFYKNEKKFDTNGNNIEEAEYYVDSNGDLDYNRGKLFEYDNANHQIQQIDINSSINGDYYTSRTNWAYGSDELLDTIRRCNYNYPNNGECKNVIMATFDYLGQDTIVNNGFTWANNAWKYYGKELTFKGQEIYSDRPDSVVFYYFWADSLVHLPTNRRQLHYEDLGNGTIYFKEEEYNYFAVSEEWLLVRVVEEWYHVKSSVGVGNLSNTQEQVLIFPNPCKLGQSLTLKQEKENLEIFFFDLHGRLVWSEVLTNQSSFQAPKQSGVYSILIRDEGRLIQVSKLIVVD